MIQGVHRTYLGKVMTVMSHANIISDLMDGSLGCSTWAVNPFDDCNWLIHSIAY